jgi:DNA-binding NtrC family response regulator
MITREVAEVMLQDWGYDTVAAGDVGEAMTILHSAQPIDALFTDIHLKTAVHGGFTVADEALTIRPNLRVLYTSGGLIQEKIENLASDGKDFLIKPYTPDQLHNAVDRILFSSTSQNALAQPRLQMVADPHGVGDDGQGRIHRRA